MEEALEGLIAELKDAPDGRPSAARAIRFIDDLCDTPERRARVVMGLACLPLDRCAVQADGTVVLDVFPHVDVPGVAPGRAVRISFDSSSGWWSSDLGAPWNPGVLGLARHVFGLRDPRETRDTAALRIFALLGFVFARKLLAERAGPVAEGLDG